MIPRKQIYLVIGTPRGFTRSVLEALLKRGTHVILACPDPSLGYSEQRRLSSLYGNSQISVNVIEALNLRKLESLLLRVLDTHGGVTNIVNSTADNKLFVHRKELVGSIESVERYLNRKQQLHEVQTIKDVSTLAVKYLGKHNGFSGGSLLNLVSRTELLNQTAAKLPQQQANLTADVDVTAQSNLDNSRLPAGDSCTPAKNNRLTAGNSCTVLGTTRALGLSKQLSKHGVKTLTVYQPNIDYPELSPASQITDDEHSPYYTWNRYSAYCREYTGYMSLHISETAQSGTAWTFNQELRLEQVEPARVPCSCKLTNKMCYWLGCPHVDRLADIDEPQEVKVNLEHEVTVNHESAVNESTTSWWRPSNLDVEECQDN